MSQLSDLSSATTRFIPLQLASWEIWDRKYRLKNRLGIPLDESISNTYQRVAHTLANVEESPALKTLWYERFLWALEHGATPAGRIISNAGAWEHKPATSTINCTVSGVIYDSMDDILRKVHEGGLTLKAGAGIGYCFSTLRPKGAYVSGAGSYTSGPLSFMDIFDRMCLTISSAGGRRGAQMATFDISHPDVVEFIQAKREDGRLRQFNLSLLVTEEFIQAVQEDLPWPLVFPVLQGSEEEHELDYHNPDHVIWKNLPVHKGYVLDHEGRVACKVYNIMSARALWDLVMQSAYDYAEPGFILIDRVNDLNNNWFCEEIRASNPCGEQFLPPYGACLLGSVNLVHFVQNPFTPQATFDWATYREVVTIFTRMLDNVVAIHGLPLPQQGEELLRKRRHGMGYLGLGSAMTMLCMTYGSPESLAFTQKVTQEMALAGWESALELAKEKGVAPIMEEDFTLTEAMFRQCPELAQDGHRPGDILKGKVLHARYSRYMRKIAQLNPKLVEDLAQIGARFTHHTAIAPTGTIALSLGNNVSNGIEPSFAHHYLRNVIREGKKSKEQMDVYSFELLAYRTLVNPAAVPFSPGRDNKNALPDYFVNADDIPPKAHIAVQSAAQEWIDASISKTINVPTQYPYEDFKDIYLEAHAKGLKGCTTFRFNPEAFQGVLVKQEEIQGTLYCFTLADGQKIEVSGDEKIEYDGEIHTAANLYEALKEGYYGRF